ncbi:MAG: hypothetical protein PVH88_04005 [Ignavibacteria bacterium]|jgi:hypothetical protein
MKNIIVVTILFTAFITAQENQTGSLLELKNEIALNIENEQDIEVLPTAEKKSVGLAIIYSLLLPGMGELYAGDYSLGKYFTIADVVSWGFVVGFNVYGSNQEDNYKAFAKTNADVNPDGKDDDYFGDIGNYLNIYDYNLEREQLRSFEEVYNLDTHYWKWENNSVREEYRSMWTNSEQAYDKVQFAVGALVINRIISAINAARIVGRHNKKVDELSWNVSVGLSQKTNLPPGVEVNLITAF